MRSCDPARPRSLPRSRSSPAPGGPPALPGRHAPRHQARELPAHRRDRRRRPQGAHASVGRPLHVHASAAVRRTARTAAAAASATGVASRAWDPPPPPFSTPVPPPAGIDMKMRSACQQPMPRGGRRSVCSPPRCTPHPHFLPPPPPSGLRLWVVRLLQARPALLRPHRLGLLCGGCAGLPVCSAAPPPHFHHPPFHHPPTTTPHTHTHRPPRCCAATTAPSATSGAWGWCSTSCCRACRPSGGTSERRRRLGNACTRPVGARIKQRPGAAGGGLNTVDCPLPGGACLPGLCQRGKQLC